MKRTLEFRSWLRMSVVVAALAFVVNARADEPSNAPTSPAATPTVRDGFEWKRLRLLPVQDRGRLKPLETLAVESVRYVTGKSSWNGMEATEVLFGWLITFDKEWEHHPFVRVDYKPLKEKLGLDGEKNYFAPSELRGIEALGTLTRAAAQKEREKEKLEEIEKKALEVRGRLGLLSAVGAGDAMAILPNPKDENGTWFPLLALTDSTKPIYEEEKSRKVALAIGELMKSFEARDASRWNRAVDSFATVASEELAPGKTGSARRLAAESQLNRVHPFRWAWIVYTIALLCIVAFGVTGRSALRGAGLGFAGLAYLIHSYGFFLRCYVAGRPPVTNMYESVIWVSWGAVVFGAIIFFAYRKIAIVGAGIAFAIVSLVLADNLPNVLDPAINPLEPVLRSNFWLTIHVLTITLSYAAFALALCIGNVVLGSYFAKEQVRQRSQELTLYMYRAMQIGVVLLAAGTILGGIWADYSWGRFWGWDPKEVWALIALLLYLAVLHGRFTGWLRGFGFVTATIVSFLGVLMAWYGVNFVLGVGLHSYGFGTGGLGYVGSYVALQLGFIAAAYVRFRKLLAEGRVDSRIFPSAS